MSHSQFHCHARVYLDMHGLIFETSICYWQDQPGSRRSCAEDRSRRRSGAGDSTSRASAGAGSGSPPPPRGGAGGGERGARGGRAREREGLRRPSPPGPSEVSLGGSGLEAALEKKSHPRRGGRTPVVEPRPWEAGAPGDARAAPWRRTAATRNLGRRGADGTPRPEHGGGWARTRREEDPHPGLRFDEAAEAGRRPLRLNTGPRRAGPRRSLPEATAESTIDRERREGGPVRPLVVCPPDDSGPCRGRVGQPGTARSACRRPRTR